MTNHKRVYGVKEVLGTDKYFVASPEIIGANEIVTTLSVLDILDEINFKNISIDAEETTFAFFPTLKAAQNYLHTCVETIFKIKAEIVSKVDAEIEAEKLYQDEENLNEEY